MAKISVIVPIYNVEPYLHRCLDSILCQTYMNFDLILVDDGSPDRCGQICDEYAEKDDRIHVIHRSNGGLSAARNEGIEWSLRNSDSYWICFIDSDDWVHPLYLELLINAVKDTSFNVAIGGYYKTNGESFPQMAEDKKKAITRKADDYYIKSVINATVSWGKLYKKELFVSLRFPVGKLHEDEYTTYRILFQQDYIAVVDLPIYAYFQNPQGIMLREWSPKRLDAIQAFEEQLSFFIGINRLDIAKFVFRRLVNCIKQNRQLIETAQISVSEKRKYQTYLNKKLQVLLVTQKRHQLFRYSESEENKQVYITAFPVLGILRQTWGEEKKILKKFPPTYFLGKAIKNNWNQQQKSLLVIKYVWKTASKQSILINSPLYRNLGDQAIALSELDCLDSLGITCCDFPWTHENPKRFASITASHKLILFQGGGNLGQLWPREEQRFRETIKAYKKNTIIVFPQTIYFDLESRDGRICFNQSKAIYESHPNLLIFVREKTSFIFMREYMPKVRVQLVPDMVMALKCHFHFHNREGAMICIRKDKERLLSESDYDRMLQHVRKYYNRLSISDTVCSGSMSLEERESALDTKLMEFAAASLVITDRLHGMIFSAITETPCIVLNSLSPKISGCYEWLKELDYIRLVDRVDEIPEIIENLKVVKPKYEHKKIEEAMKPLYEALIEATK